ncbi:MAG: hypothetical protein KDA84_14530, partial [Planctomycetaceae bacterium]|nr:hypothetical protein [Planctomycetaceae bacterium]
MWAKRRDMAWLVFLLAGLASLGIAVVSVDGAARTMVALSTLVPWAMALISGWILSVRYGDRPSPPVWLPVVILMIGLTSLVEEWIRREFFSSGRAFEMMLLCGLRNAMLAAAAGSIWRSIERVTAMLSLFLMMFAVMAGD